MNKVLLTSVFLSAAALVAHAGAAPPQTAPSPLTSGFKAENFDKTVRPQDDFYKFVNGGWLAKTQIPPEKTSFGSFDELFDLTETQVKTIIETSAQQPNRRPGTV